MAEPNNWDEERLRLFRKGIGAKPMDLGTVTVRAGQDAGGTDTMAPIQVRGTPQVNPLREHESQWNAAGDAEYHAEKDAVRAEIARRVAEAKKEHITPNPVRWVGEALDRATGGHGMHPFARYHRPATEENSPANGTAYNGETVGAGDGGGASGGRGGGGGSSGGGGGPGVGATGQTYDLVDPKRRGYFENAADEQQGAARDIAMADRDKARATAELHGQAGDFYAQEQERQMKAAKANKAYQETLLQNLNSASEEMANKKVDPKRFWKNAGTGTTIAYFLAAVGQGFVSARLGKDGNPVLDQLQQQVSQDIEAQKHDIQQGNKRVEDMKGIYAEALKITGDFDKATTAAHYMALNSIEQRLKQRMAEANDPEIVARYKMVVSQIEQSKQSQLMHMEKYVDPRLAALMAQGGAGFNRHDEESTRHLSDKLSALGLPGLSQAITDFEQASAASGPMGRVERYIYHVPGVGPMVTSDKKIATEQALTNLHDQFNRMITGAGQSEGEAERRWKTVVGDGSPAAIKRGLGMIQKFAAENEAVLRSGASDKVNVEYDRRLGNQHPNAQRDAVLRAVGSASAPARK